ncbi:MAG TPA: thiamine phosphate synthase [Methanocorpusculum sp.]|jgi:thiamine-phosphate pyrophosphorylase|nr:thiamine phosphate synthase [Methanocorpusculum sp.]HJJ52911.1 thiamine phosphate synthase [Methanocorpusculum sp.]
MKYDLYVVTDEDLSNGRSHAEIAQLATIGGADVIQLRDKKMNAADLFAVALQIREITKDKALFIVNDRVDIALASKADGVHLGQRDLPVKAVRRIVPNDFIIGISIGSVDEALKGVRDGANYVAVSPVFSTSSKQDAGLGLGVSCIAAVRKAVPANIPVVGIGGLNSENILEVISAGLDGVCVIFAVVSAPDITKAAKDLREKIRMAKNE